MKMSEVKYILKWAKKFKAVSTLGGECFICGESNPYVLDFHHKNRSEKKFQISKIGLHKNWESIEQEIKKCILLCRNCHIKQHCLQIKARRLKIKQQMLEYKKCFKCCCCGKEDKTGIFLEFHHIKKKDKGIGYIISSSTNSNTKRDFVLTGQILKELDKCVVICRNCHVLEHIDMSLQNRLKPDIEKKIILMKSNQTLDSKKIMPLYKQGMSPKKIGDTLGYKCSSVEYYVYKKYRNPR